jgi:hypothetical protein
MIHSSFDNIPWKRNNKFNEIKESYKNGKW